MLALQSKKGTCRCPIENLTTVLSKYDVKERAKGQATPLV